MYLTLEQLSGMSNTKILVYGWYHNKNIGDDLFIDSFKKLFPEFNFTFTNYITVNQLNSNDAVFFGGGSFLYADVNCEDKKLLTTKLIFYVGVGIEKYIHPTHIELLKIARIICSRSAETINDVRSLNSNTILIPDIVFCLKKTTHSTRVKNSVLVLPNSCVLPKYNDQHWKYAAWNYFKSEYAQFLDILIENNYNVHMFPMCTNSKSHDHLASAEIINNMKNGSYNLMISADAR
jgi:polysaccharide pyruvyl transferase WcaK-like protein